MKKSSRRKKAYSQKGERKREKNREQKIEKKRQEFLTTNNAGVFFILFDGAFRAL